MDLHWCTLLPSAEMPQLGYPGDAGIDLPTLNDVTVAPGDTVDVATGIAVAFPDGVWGLILGRSSTLRRRRLIVNPGVIDTGYTGELFVCVHNHGQYPVSVKAGDRLGQLILLPNLADQVSLRRVHTLPPTERGDKGFGSTGY